MGGTGRRRVAAPLILLAMAASVSCGGGGDGSQSAATVTSTATRPADTQAAPVPPAVPPSALPAVTVLDVPSGDEVALDSLIPSDRPLLVWFWAPH